MNVDGDLEDIRWILGLGRQRLPAASYALLPNLKKGLFFAIGERLRFFVVCFLHTREQIFSYQTPGRHPPRTTGRVEDTVTKQWVGAPTSVPHSEIMARLLVLSIDLCRGLGISPLRMKHLAEFFSGRSWPNICPGMIFFGFIGKFETFFFEKLCPWRAAQKSYGDYILKSFFFFLSTSRFHCHRSHSSFFPLLFSVHLLVPGNI